MIGVDDEIAGRECRQFREEGIRALAPLLAPHQPVAEHVLLGEHRDLGRGEAMIERQDKQGGIGFRPDRFLPCVGLLDAFQPVIGEQPGQPLPRAATVARQDYLVL